MRCASKIHFYQENYKIMMIYVSVKLTLINLISQASIVLLSLRSSILPHAIQFI
jgi:hypothetical protein